MKNFSSIIAPMTEILKCKRFEWNEKVQAAFEDIKSKLTSAPILALPSFFKVFEVKCDALELALGWFYHKKADP